MKKMSNPSVYKQSAIIFGLNWLIAPLDFFTAALVARALGPEGKGVLLLIGAIAGGIMTFANLGISYGAVFYYKQGKHTLGQILGASLTLTIVPTIIAFLGFAFFSDSLVNLFIHTSENVKFQTAWIWIPLLCSLFHMLFSLGDILLVRDNKMKLYSIKAISTPLIRIVFTLLLVLALGLGVFGVLVSQLLAAIVGVGVPVFWLTKMGAFRSLRLSLNTIKDMLRIGLQRYGITLVTLINKRFDAFLIAGLMTIQDVGFFSIAWGVLNIFVTIPRATMWPLVTKLVSKEEDKLSQFAQVTRIQVMLMIILMIVFAPLVPIFIHIVYGESFMPAAGAVWLILPSIISMPFVVSGNAYFSGKGKPGITLIPLIIATSIQVVISLILVPTIGVLGGAIGLSINTITLSSILIFLIVRDSGLRPSELIIMTRKDWSVLYDYITPFIIRKLQKFRKA